jgi:hypothetical protein
LPEKYFDVQVKEDGRGSISAGFATNTLLPNSLLKVLAQRIILNSSQRQSLDVEQYLGFFVLII